MELPLRQGLILIITTLLLLCQPTGLWAEGVRGRLVRGPYPISGVAVTLFNPGRGQSGVSYSGPDGMYYLFNIPPGPYTLQIWDNPNRPPMQFSIIVYPQQPWSDIAPIQIR